MPSDKAAKEMLLEARAAGATLREAADAAGVHVATVCRWQNRDPQFRERMRQSHHDARREEIALNSGPRPPVRCRRDCPLCRARVVVRTARAKLRFWRCGRWPLCRWASWRPRAPRNCRRCGGACFWSHSRQSIGCGACGLRIIPLSLQHKTRKKGDQEADNRGIFTP